MSNKKKICYKKNCNKKAVRQDGDKNLMCEEHFKDWIKKKTAHKINPWLEL